MTELRKFFSRLFVSRYHGLVCFLHSPMRNPRQNALDTWAVWIETIHGGARALHCWCRVLSCLVLSLRSACLFAHKGSGSYVHFNPRPCSSTCRWAGLATHQHWRPLCVDPVLLCPLWPCNHCMCVITCSRTWTFLRRPPHLGAPIPLFEYRSLQKTTIQKLAIISPETHTVLL